MNKNKARDARRKRELQRLQAAIAKQQAQVAQSRQQSVAKDEVQPVGGMPADVVLTLPGFAKKNRTRKPELVGYNKNGLIVRWYYQDVALVMKRYGKPFTYRVAEIEEGESNEQTSRDVKTSR